MPVDGEKKKEEVNRIGLGHKNRRLSSPCGIAAAAAPPYQAFGCFSFDFRLFARYKTL